MPAATVTRRALYDLVWSEPMLRLAKQYGISDVGLAKVCLRHSIPRPPRGYWAKKAAGKSPAQIPLPDPDDDCQIQIAGFGLSSDGAAVTEDIRELIEEDAPAFRIETRDHLRGAHKLVSQTRRELQSPRVDREGLIILPDDLPLDLRVSKATLRRALLLMDALLRALEEHGDAVGAGPRVTLLNISVRFGITEILETHREDAEPDDFTGLYSFSYNRVRSKRIPSGRLSLLIHEELGYGRQGARRVWRDTATQRLEGRLKSFLAGLVEFAGRMRQEKEQHRREQEARAAAERHRQEVARQQAARRAAIEAERKRLDGLIEASQRWKKSNLLREYIEATRHAHSARHGAVDPGSEMAEWLEWATRQADWLDPLTDSPPSLLDEHPGDGANDGAAYRRSW